MPEEFKIVVIALLGCIEGDEGTFRHALGEDAAHLPARIVGGRFLTGGHLLGGAHGGVLTHLMGAGARQQGKHRGQRPEPDPRGVIRLHRRCINSRANANSRQFRIEAPPEVPLTEWWARRHGAPLRKPCNCRLRQARRHTALYGVFVFDSTSARSVPDSGSGRYEHHAQQRP